MKTHSHQIVQLVITLATVLFGVGSLRAANLVYFNEGRLLATIPRGLYDYDTGTGISTFRTSVPGSERLFSLDVRPSDGTVFAIDAGFSRLMTIDPSTGQLRDIGGPGVEGLRYTELSFDPQSGILFGLAFESGTLQRSLVTISTSDGSVTEIGSLPIQGTGSTALEFLSDGSLVLYESVGSNLEGRLYNVDPTTASLTLIGNTSGINTLVDFAHVGNQLFASSHGQGGTFLWEINVTTGSPTPLNAPATGLGYGGLVALAPIPEPSTWLLLGSGIAALAVQRRIRKGLIGQPCSRKRSS